MKERGAIIATFIYPPIPLRQFDWQAVRQDYEPGMAIGHGETELKAITDLLDKEDDENDGQD